MYACTLSWSIICLLSVSHYLPLDYVKPNCLCDNAYNHLHQMPVNALLTTCSCNQAVHACAAMGSC